MGVLRALPGAADAERAPAEVDAVPLQTERLTLPQAERQRERPAGAVAPPGRSFQETLDLRHVVGLHVFLVEDRCPREQNRVASQVTAAHCFVQGGPHGPVHVVGGTRGKSSAPVLLVVDYAKTRAGLGDLLRAVLDDPGRVRVLLLARSAGEWWDRLAEESSAAVGRLLAAAGPVRLEAPVSGELSDAELAAAVPFFARALGVPVPSAVVFDLPAGRRVPVLVLHGRGVPGAGRRHAGPVPPRPRPLAVQPRHLVLGAGPPGRRAARHEEAVAIRRELAAALPDRYRPDLARSLSNLSEILARLGLREEAAAAAAEYGQLKAYA